MAKVTMPQLGESVAEGTIGRWLKQPGDAVAKYEPLLEVITDKVNAEVPSPYAGVLREILVEEGPSVPNNAEIAVIETAEEAASGLLPRRRRSPAPAAAATPSPAPAAPAAAASAAAPTPGPGRLPRRHRRPIRPPLRADGRRLSLRRAPRARRRSRRPHDAGRAPPAPRARPRARPDRGHRRRRPDHPRGRPRARRGAPHRRSSVRPSARRRLPRHAPAAAAPAPCRTGRAPAAPAIPAIAATRPRARHRGPGPIVFPPGADEVLVPMTQMRKGIAAQMTRALQAPHAYVQMEVDATRLVRLRDRLKGAYQAKEGISLSFVPFVVKAAPTRSSATRPSTPTGPSRACSPSGGSTSASRSPWTTASSCRSSATPTRSRSTASTWRSPTSPGGPGRAGSASTTSAAARSRWTTPATSAPTS